MSQRPPWIKPALTFGVPLLALVAGLPYLTGRGYDWLSFDGLSASLKDARHSVAHIVAGDRSAGPGATVRLYECSTATGKVLADKPCGAGARIHDIDPNAVSHFEPPKAPPPASAAADSGRSGPAGLLRGVREDLSTAQSVDASHRALAEADAE